MLKLVLDQATGHHILSKLTHKINTHCAIPLSWDLLPHPGWDYGKVVSGDLTRREGPFLTSHWREPMLGRNHNGGGESASPSWCPIGRQLLCNKRDSLHHSPQWFAPPNRQSGYVLMRIIFASRKDEPSHVFMSARCPQLLTSSQH